MKFYEELADWWPIMSSPNDYEEEANLYLEIIRRYKHDVKTGLELGSGGGNNALYFKKHYQMTLTDLAPGMIDVSRKLNPECEHVISDMRDLHLNQKFDLVFIHDAISYITTETDLKKVFTVAFDHLKEDGLLFIAPDMFTETFKPETESGGHDDGDRSLRYLEWTSDQDPNDTVVEVDYVFVLKERGKESIVRYDPTLNGLFPKSTWEKLLAEVGFKVYFEVINHSELEPGSYIGIVGQKQ